MRIVFFDTGGGTFSTRSHAEHEERGRSLSRTVVLKPKKSLKKSQPTTPSLILVPLMLAEHAQVFGY